MIKKLYYVQPKRLYRELRLYEIDEHRKLNCIFYELCLDTTTARKFISFTCKDCVFYVADRREQKESCDYQELVKFIEENPNDPLAQKLKRKLGENDGNEC